MNITRSGSQPSTRGPADWFTGSVRIDSRFEGTTPARVAGATVPFEPGARTAWHRHPLGQTLIVTFGCGRAQRDGRAVDWMEHVSDEQVAEGYRAMDERRAIKTLLRP